MKKVYTPYIVKGKKRVSNKMFSLLGSSKTTFHYVFTYRPCTKPPQAKEHLRTDIHNQLYWKLLSPTCLIKY